MIAYKFLRTGAVGPFTGFVWPLPSGDGAPGEWVSGDGLRGPCAPGVHACRAGDLPIWLSDELWVAELAGPVTEARSKIVAPRGRLLRRVDAWNPQTAAEFCKACAQRTKRHADRVLGAADAGPRVTAAVGYASDAAAVSLAGGAPASVAYMAVRAAINAASSPVGGRHERQWQARWMRDRLSLA